MRKSLLLLWLCILLFSCPLKAEEKGLQFGWPVPSRLRVKEVKIQDESRWVTVYELRFVKAEGKKGFLLRFDEVRPLTMDGEKVPEETENAVEREVLALARLHPSLRVDAAGKLLEVTDLEPILEQMTKLALAREPEANEARRAEIRKRVRSERVVESLEEEARLLWSRWVGSWTGLQLEAGELRQTTYDVTLPDGSVVGAPAVLKNEGPVEGRAEAIRMSFVTRLGGDRARSAMANYVERLIGLKDGQGEEGDKGLPPDWLTSVERSTRLSAVLDPADLRPFEVENGVALEIRIKGVKPIRRVESQTYHFEWLASSEEDSSESPR